MRSKLSIMLKSISLLTDDDVSLFISTISNPQDSEGWIFRWLTAYSNHAQ
jgi:hypothetical protein